MSCESKFIRKSRLENFGHSSNQRIIKKIKEGEKKLDTLNKNGKDKASKITASKKQEGYLKMLYVLQMLRIVDHYRSFDGITQEEAEYFNKHKGEHEDFEDYPVLKPKRY